MSILIAKYCGSNSPLPIAKMLEQFGFAEIIETAAMDLSNDEILNKEYDQILKQIAEMNETQGRNELNQAAAAQVSDIQST